MQNQLTSMPSEKSSLTRRGVVAAFASVAAVAILPCGAEARSDELSFLIDTYREVRDHRLSLRDRLDALDADEPSTVVKDDEIKPSIGRCSGYGCFTYDQAERFFSTMQTNDQINDMARERHARSWAFAKALFLERQAQYDRWNSATGFTALEAEEEMVFNREAALLHSIVSRPCSSFAEARTIADFVTSDIPDSTFHEQHACALRSIAGLAS